MNRKYFELISFMVIASLIIARVFYHAVHPYVPFVAVGVYFLIKYFILKVDDDEEEESQE